MEITIKYKLESYIFLNKNTNGKLLEGEPKVFLGHLVIHKFKDRNL